MSELAKKKRVSKGQFAKRIIILDLLALLLFGFWGMFLATKGIDASATLGVIYAVGGGELLLLMIKKMFKGKGSEEDE